MEQPNNTKGFRTTEKMR